MNRPVPQFCKPYIDMRNCGTELEQVSKDEKQLAARAWAEFLYEEYCLEKQNRLILCDKRRTIKKLTNHDKLNS